MSSFRVKIKSSRTGKIGWLDRGAVPRDHKSEAHVFGSLEAATKAFDEYADSLRRVTGHCRWVPEFEDA